MNLSALHKLFVAFSVCMACSLAAYSKGNTLKPHIDYKPRSLSFVENKGQVQDQNQQPRPDIDFKLQAAKGLNIFIGKGALHYQWAQPAGGDQEPAGEENTPSVQPLNFYRMDVTLVGANPQAQVVTDGREAFYERYYLAAAPEGATAHAFSKITYKDIYPNIDWTFYISDKGQLEYDFIIRPGGKVSDIKLRYGGASQLHLNADGSLGATTPMGTITERAPYSFQQDGKAVDARFVLEGNMLSFTTAPYNGTLTIDPVLEWSTYFGGDQTDDANQIATDNFGNYYITGYTISSANIATSGAYQTSYEGSVDLLNEGDVFLAKFNDTGERIWATYYGGNGAERAFGIACDSYGAIYITGKTQSATNIATTASYQDTLGAIYNYSAFLAKFDSAGILQWGTYYGGLGADESNPESFGQAVVCIPSGGVVMTGYLGSSGRIAFLAHFDENGNILWNNTSFNSFAVDNKVLKSMGISYGEGALYMTGNTNCAEAIATSSSFQETIGGGYDAFLAKFDTATGTMNWATYFGGPGNDYGTAVHCAPDGKVYISGYTTSTSGIATPGAQQETIGTISGPSYDIFLAAFNNAGERQWSTYYGGATYDNSANSIASDPLGNIYITGSTNSSVNIASPDTYQENWAGGYDIIIAKFNPAGQRIWGTYYGGSGTDYGRGIVSDNAGNIYITGSTVTTTGFTTPGSFQTTISGVASDAFLIKFSDCELPATPGSITGATTLCSGTPATFSIDTVAGASSYTWVLPEGWTGSSDSAGIEVIPGDDNGTIYVAANNYCATGDSASLEITVNPSPVPVIAQNNNILSTTLPFETYQWLLNNEAIAGATNPTYVATAAGDYSVSVTNEEGCSGVSGALHIGGGTGIDNTQPSSNSITIYPNPVKDYLYLQCREAIDINISTIDGRTLQAGRLSRGMNPIDFTGYAKGVYLLRIYSADGTFMESHKIIKL